MDIKNYLESYYHLIESDNSIQKIEHLAKKIKLINSNGGSLLIFGNGASASIASHAALDFTKQAKIRSLCFHDPALLTAFSNDYGYDQALSRIFDFYSGPEDIIIGISVSGESKNLIELFKNAKGKGIHTVSFTGKERHNSLQALADDSLWVDSHAYNIVESVHQIWITSIIDFVIGKSVYEVS